MKRMRLTNYFLLDFPYFFIFEWKISKRVSNSKVRYSFEKGILIITYEDGAVIEVQDVIEYYDHGLELSGGKKFCVIFNAVGQFTVTREAWEYIAENPYSDRILAKGYVTDSPETESKAVFHIRMDKPQLVPMTFWNLKAAKRKMREILAKSQI